MAAAIAIWQAVNPDEPDEYEGALSDPEAASQFIEFLRDRDGEIVRVEATCLGHEPESGPPDYRQAWCGMRWDELTPFGPAHPMNGRDDLTEVWLELNNTDCLLGNGSTCPGTVQVNFYGPLDSDANFDNGSYGAGNLVVSGFFAVDVNGRLGTAQPHVDNVIYMRAVNNDEAT